MAEFPTARERIVAHATGFDAHKRTIDTATDLAAINDFVFNICEDPTLVATFRENPDEVLRAAGIDPELGEFIKAGHRYIEARATRGGLVKAGAANGGGSTTVVVVVVVVV